MAVKEKKRMKKILIAAALVFVTLTTGNAIADESLSATIQAREDAWAAAFNAANKGDLGAFYEESAVLIPPGSPPIRGRAAIVEFFATLFPRIEHLKLVTDEVRSVGPDYAVEIGHSEYTAIGEDGSRSPAVDNYQVVWHRGADGVWLYVTDMFNRR